MARVREREGHGNVNGCDLTLRVVDPSHSIGNPTTKGRHSNRTASLSLRSLRIVCGRRWASSRFACPATNTQQHHAAGRPPRFGAGFVTQVAVKYDATTRGSTQLRSAQSESALVSR